MQKKKRGNEPQRQRNGNPASEAVDMKSKERCCADPGFGPMSQALLPSQGHRAASWETWRPQQVLAMTACFYKSRATGRGVHTCHYPGTVARASSLKH